MQPVTMSEQGRRLLDVQQPASIAPTLPGLEPAPAVRVAFLGSGSSGNATAVASGDTLVLVDCGFSARETKRRLVAAGLGGMRIAALLVTHEHTDHIAGLRVLTKRGDVAVHASVGTWRSGRLGERTEHSYVAVPGERVRIGDIEVDVFASSHDSNDPVGYVFSAAGRRIGVCTDCGHLTAGIAEALAGCDLLGIESNHDLDMLERGPYPRFLKRRILSARGHLSNVQACQALERLAGNRLKHVVGLHLSRTNNAPTIASRALTARARSLGLDAAVTVASQFEPLVVDLGEAES